ncbi:hypothetical protein [Anatilimnocola floriformis]|uniref:hypothetical protein n=1 Tax=Anatilimnocola floriformis TaxID=2948575 RepID=UPI0020C35934|nr:hypothetical protein [Anatilimnocola floriformis]
MNTLVTAKRRSTQQQASVKHRSLFLEGLEGRAVLAGNVWAAAIGGNLMIQGDAADNGLHLQTMSDGSVQLSGVNAGGSATTINGSSAPFVASDVQFLTRVALGNGNDNLTVDGQASASTTANANQQLLIQTGSGADTVSAKVANEANLHLLGSTTDDNISVNSTAADSSSPSNLAGGTNDGYLPDESGQGDHLDPNNPGGGGGSGDGGYYLPDDSDLGDHLDPNTNSDGNASNFRTLSSNSSSAGEDVNVDAAVEADVTAAIDDVGQSTASGIGTNADIDTVMTANLALSSALNSSANIGPSALLNTDQNLNGSIGGAAALNITGDNLFDEVGLFNNASLADIDTNLAAQIALANANNFGVAGNNVDSFFANLNSQSDVNAQAGINSSNNAAILGSLGANDLTPGSLNTNVNGNLNGAFTSRLGLPLG